MEVGDSEFTVRYMHFLFTHFPVDLDADCAYRADNAQWVEANQTEVGARRETICVLRSARQIIEKLRQLEVYDNSTIVIKSDHGKKATYYGSEPQNLGFSGSSEWGYDRYRPLLMIKPAGREADGMAMTDRPAAISDLAATLCAAGPTKRRCGDYPGVDLMSPTGTDEPPVRIFVPKSANSTHRFEDLKPVELERGTDLRELAGQ